MTDMLEKAARVMASIESDESEWESYVGTVSAVLKTLREPLSEVIEAGMIAGGFTGYADVAWTAMIDAILEGKA